MSSTKDVVSDVHARLTAGAPPSDAELRWLAESADLISLGMLADEARRQRHDRRVTFVRVAELPLNGTGGGSPSIAPAAREVRLVGMPESLDQALEAVRAAVVAAAGRPVTGFAIDDWETLYGGDSARVTGALRALREAGLGLMAELVLERAAEPEALCDAAREADIGIARLVTDRSDSGETLRWSETAERLGRRASVRSFAPLPRDPEVSAASTGYQDVRRVALARLMVRTIDSIQIDWALHGPKLAQVGLTFGADDLDRVSPADSSELGRRRASIEEVRQNIKAAGYEPAERDGRFALLQS